MSGTMTEMAYQLPPAPPPEAPPAAFDWDDYYAHVVIEDDEPVDSIYAEKQQRLLAEPLHVAWTPPSQPGQSKQPGRSFLAAVNVGVFGAPGLPPIVPDFFLSLDVKARPLRVRRNRSYFLREFGKPPEVAVEIVSDKTGGELSRKLDRYAELGVRYYVVFDPDLELSREYLQLFELSAGVYQRRADLLLPEVGLGLTLWDGEYEDWPDMWLRWTALDGSLIPLSQESVARAEDRAAQAEDQAERAADRAEQAADRAAREAEARRLAEAQAAQAELRAAQLAAQLRALGIEPEQG